MGSGAPSAVPHRVPSPLNSETPPGVDLPAGSYLEHDDHADNGFIISTGASDAPPMLQESHVGFSDSDDSSATLTDPDVPPSSGTPLGDVSPAGEYLEHDTHENVAISSHQDDASAGPMQSHDEVTASIALPASVLESDISIAPTTPSGPMSPSTPGLEFHGLEMIRFTRPEEVFISIPVTAQELAIMEHHYPNHPYTLWARHHVTAVRNNDGSDNTDIGAPINGLIEEKRQQEIQRIINFGSPEFGV